MQLARVISLPSSPRRDFVNKNRDKINVGFEYFDAIRISKDGEDFDCIESMRVYEKVPKESEMSCALSHFECIKMTNVYCILEDDFLVNRRIDIRAIIDEIKKIDRPFVLILGHSKHNYKDNLILRLKQPLKNKRKLSNETIGTCNAVNYFGAVAYVFNDQFKNSMRKINKPYWVADDWKTIKKATNAEIYHLNCMAITENLNESYKSSIGNKVHFRHDFRKSPVLQTLKIIRAQLINILDRT